MPASSFEPTYAAVFQALDAYLDPHDRPSPLTAAEFNTGSLARFVGQSARGLEHAPGVAPEFSHWVAQIAAQALALAAGREFKPDHGQRARGAAESVFEKPNAESFAHDLNNEVVSVKALAEELRSSGLAASADAIVSEIEDVVDLMAEATDDFRRGMGGRARAPLAPIDLGKLLSIRKVRSVVGPDVDVFLTLPSDLSAVIGARGLLWRAVTNLLKNAREAMSASVERRLEISADPVSLTSESGIAAGDYVRLSFRDTGGGLPPSLEEAPFQAFRSTKQEGDAPARGLGLWGVAEIVRGLGGMVTAKSSRGTGTAFHVYLPAASRPAAPSEDISGYLAGKHGGRSILLVDDSAIMLIVLHKYLQRLGYGKIIRAGSAERALEILKSQSVDLIVTDQNMEGMPGSELIKAVRSSRPDFPFILCTGTADIDFPLEGNSRKIPKPARIVELARAVKELLELSEEPRESGSR